VEEPIREGRATNLSYRKKLIEVALPMEWLNEASRKEKNPFTKKHPRAIHVWWSRKPLTTSRAVLFASLVDDPSEHPDLFPTQDEQEEERARLFRVIGRLVTWESAHDAEVLAAARKEILKSTGGVLPAVLDPFCGGGSIPLEAQRLGLRAYAGDLNPVAVLITKALVEIPPRFSNRKPVNASTAERFADGVWEDARGLVEDIKYYGGRLAVQAADRIGSLYPESSLPKEHGGGRAPTSAWLWARTVKCPNPACGARAPLMSKLWLSSKKGRKAWLDPAVDHSSRTVRFLVRTGEGEPRPGTMNRQGGVCLVCENPIPFDYIRAEGRAGGMGQQLLATVVKLAGGRLFLEATQEHEALAAEVRAPDILDSQLPEQALGFRVQLYGMTTHSALFTARQLFAMDTFCQLVIEIRKEVLKDALLAGLSEDGVSLADGGSGAAAYADAISTYLGTSVSRFADFSNILCSWDSGNTNLRQLFARQALPMVWDYAETNPLSGVVTIESAVNWTCNALAGIPHDQPEGSCKQLDAVASVNAVTRPVVCTDPPYYDNIGYADLADFFYVWLRRSLGETYPDLFSTLLTPKSQELVATPFRFGGNRDAARSFFEDGFRKAFSKIRESHNPDFPMTLFYAFKQAESTSHGSGEDLVAALASTGWESMLEGLLKSGWTITGTWPMRTEQSQRSVAAGANALASSIVLVCRPREDSAPLGTRKQFMAELRRDFPDALRKLQHGNIAPVDLAQAAIGPAMAIFSKYARVVEADGSSMTVRKALELINQALAEILSAQESDYDSSTRWAVAWFEQFGMTAGPFGDADNLARAKNTAVNALKQDGIIDARGGKVRLLPRDELEEDWDPTSDPRLRVWEITQHLVRALSLRGEEGAASILRKVGSLGEVARDLAYWLYTLCERKKWSEEAQAYNSLVVAWPEIQRLTSQFAEPRVQGDLFS
jgi:putative DNA methylase